MFPKRALMYIFRKKNVLLGILNFTFGMDYRVGLKYLCVK